MAPKFAESAEGQLRLNVESSTPEAIRTPGLTEEQEDKLDRWVDGGGLTYGEAFRRLGVRPAELTVVDSSPTPASTTTEDALDGVPDVPDGAGMNSYMARVKQGLSD